MFSECLWLHALLQGRVYIHTSLTDSEQKEEEEMEDQKEQKEASRKRKRT